MKQPPHRARFLSESLYGNHTVVNLHHAERCFTRLIHNMKRYMFSNRFPAGNKWRVTTARLTVDTIIHLIGKCKMTIFKLSRNCSILAVLGPVISLRYACAFSLRAAIHGRAELLFTAFLFHLPSPQHLPSPLRALSFQTAPLALAPFVVAHLPAGPFEADTSDVQLGHCSVIRTYLTSLA